LFLLRYLVTEKTVRKLCPEFLSEHDKKIVEEVSENGKSEEGENGIAPSNIKLKGQNKKRPPPMKFSMEERICPTLVNVAENEPVKECSFGDKCSYKHDLAAFMSQRKPDIMPDGCYTYRTLGRCSRGVSCLFGSEHLTDEGRNKLNPNPTDPNSSTYSNFLSKDLQKTLRKKQYDFKPSQTIVESNKNVKKKETRVDEPEAKKICLETTGPITNEDMIALKPEEKKKIDWAGKLYLAPLTTVGNLPFRRMCKTLGVDITCGEMAMGDSIVDGGQHEWALVRRHSSEDLYGVQICGSNPYILSKCGQLLQEQTDIDFIDLNLGCPIDGVYSKGAGSGLMQRRNPLEQSIRSLSQLLDIPFTVKMRTGVYGNQPIAHQLVKQCHEWGVSMVTVHGRSREQRYTKLSDWDYITKCVQAADPMPLFGNGDILSFEDYEAHVASSGVAGVMIGRGALIKPWIFTEIKERRHWDISSSERFQYMRNFANYGLEHWGSDSQVPFILIRINNLQLLFSSLLSLFTGPIRSCNVLIND